MKKGISDLAQTDPHHYVPAAYFFVRQEPCFVHPLFRRKSKDPADIDKLYSPRFDVGNEIAGFDLLTSLDDVVFLPEGHPALASLRKVGDCAPVFLRIKEDVIKHGGSVSELRLRLSDAEFEDVSAHPFFALGFARLAGEEELEFSSAVKIYQFLAENIPGLEPRWAASTVLTPAVRKRFDLHLQNIQCLDENEIHHDTLDKFILRVVICIPGMSRFVGERVYERENLIFRIEFEEMGLDYVANHDDLIAIIGRRGMFGAPFPFAAHSGRFFFSIEEGEPTRLASLPSLLARNREWRLGLNDRSEIDVIVEVCIDAILPTIWPSVFEDSIWGPAEGRR